MLKISMKQAYNMLFDVPIPISEHEKIVRAWVREGFVRAKSSDRKYKKICDVCNQEFQTDWMNQRTCSECFDLKTFREKIKNCERRNHGSKNKF